MEIIIAIAAKIAEYTVAPVGRQLGYLFHYPTNVQNLKKELQDLKNAEDRMKHDVSNARNNCDQIHLDVESWLKNVDEVSSEANKFLNHEDHAKVVCSCGSLPHLVTRHQLSRKAKKMSIHVSKVLQDNKFNQMNISYRPTNLPRQESSSAITTGFEDFYSRKEILKNVMAAVRDVGTHRIGLCGMGGIGKTMLAKEFARKVEKLFSKVVLVPISQNPDLKEIQQHIADMLELKFGETDNSMSKRASLLQQRLKPDNKILLILDDIWKELDLKEIGIHEECWMLLTSRNGQVLSNDMGILENNIFKIEVLDFQEAINLFKKISGDIVENLDYNDLALKIVEECGGLPICIATVAHALKCSKEKFIWENALKQLQSSNFTEIHGMDDKVYSSIRMSYDFLRSREAKSLLLLCALHKEDENIPVEDLMKYSWGCRLIRETNTVKEARNRVNTLVDNLKSRCLLLDSWRKGYVKMHDVIRDVCLSVAKEKEHRMYNITNVDMYGGFVKDETNKECKALSFLSYDDYEFPQKLECPSLELLLLTSHRYLKSFPDDFFGQTTKLEALQMEHIRYILPSSFQSLQNLQTLCLRETGLEDIAVIGRLQNLKVLDLSLSHAIKLLPKEIGQLRRLQLLDLRHCNELEVIEPNVISNLTQMEELYLPGGFQGWETEESNMEERRNVSLEEIKSLQQLTVLYLSTPRANILPEGMFSGKLERYKVSIGDLVKEFDIDDESLRWLHLNLSTMNEINVSGLKSLINRSKYLSLKNLDFSVDPCFDEKVSRHHLVELTIDSCNNLKYLFSFSIAQNFVSLKKITVRTCLAIEDIVVKVGEEEIQLERILFPKLESIELLGLSHLQRFCVSNSCMEFPLLSHLIIYECPKLKTFVSSPTTDHKEVNRLVSTQSLFNEKVSFPNLEGLTINSCNNLKYLFSFSIAQNFESLKMIEISQCEAIEDIVVKAGEEEIKLEMILFPKLEFLMLANLSHLQRFCVTNSYMEFPLLSELMIQHCPKLKTFVSSPTTRHKEVNLLVSTQFFNEKAFVSLANADHEEENQLLSAKVFSPNLKELTIESCDNLKYLFSFSLAQQKFIKLKKIKVQDCKAMEDIVAKVGEKEIKLEMILFPKLESLELLGLSNLKRFCATDSCMEFPLLSKLTIKDCPKLMTFVSSPIVDHQEVNQLVSMQSFFNEKTIYPSLKELIIVRCNNLKYLLPFFIAQNLVQLKTLHVLECENIEKVIVGDMESCGSNATIFEKLQILWLGWLPNLVKFCEGDCIECPLLSDLKIINTPKMKEFISNSMDKRACIVSEEIGMVAVPKQSVFIDKVVSPNLKELITDWSEAVEEIFESKSSQSSSIFSNLSKLYVGYESKDKTIAISDVKSFLHKYRNIHTLQLRGSFVDGHQQQQPGHGDGLSDGDGETSELTELVITYCSRLQGIELLSISFHKLKILIIKRCAGLTCLFTISTTTTLLQLEELKIIDCTEMREVITRDYCDHDQPEHHPLVFHKLHTLMLKNLQYLKSFYSGTKVMSFPKLKELYVRRCPDMVTFSNGTVTTDPCLNTIVGIQNWEGDVNTTVRKYWEDDDDVEFDSYFDAFFDFDDKLQKEGISFHQKKKEEGISFDMDLFTPSFQDIMWLKNPSSMFSFNLLDSECPIAGSYGETSAFDLFKPISTSTSALLFSPSIFEASTSTSAATNGASTSTSANITFPFRASDKRKYIKVKRRQRKNRPSVLGSNSQVSKSRPTTNSSPTSTSAATNGASSAMFASSNAASSSSSSVPASTTQPVFGASSGQNHQMSMEDSMAEDTPSAPSPLAFGSAPAP